MVFLAHIAAADGQLVDKTSWEQYIDELEHSCNVGITDKNEMKLILKERLVEAVSKRLPKERFGLLLSGGVDSSLLALLSKQLGGNFICYSVGMEDSKDVPFARQLCEQLGLPLRLRLFTLQEAEDIIRQAVRIIGPEVVGAGVASVEIAAILLAKEDNVSMLMGGIGSEEIFAGYQRHELADDINKECWRGLRKMHDRDFVRDFAVARALEVSFITPFLDEMLICAAMSMPGNVKIVAGEKKMILRESAQELGLPSQFAFRKKIAAQYGSGFDKAIERLAKQNGFSFKKDYLLSLCI